MVFGFKWWRLFKQIYHRRGPGTRKNESSTGSATLYINHADGKENAAMPFSWKLHYPSA